MSVAVVALDFDPVLRLAGLAVRLETLGTAAGILAALLLAARIALRTPAPEHDREGRWLGRHQLRLDDLVYMVLAALPGAVLGGRIGYVLLHLDYYRVNPGAIVDAGQGSLELAFGVAGGALTAGYAARVLSESVGRWLHVATLPTLVALGTGKAAMALGGSGQGSPSSAEWATAYRGGGPWGALVPAIPAHPAQMYEAAAIALILALLVLLSSAGVFRPRTGLAWFVGVGGWAAARTAVATAWLDAPVLGPLRAGQLLSLALLAGCVLGAWVVTRRRGATSAAAAGSELQWPDPETRPRF